MIETLVESRSGISTNEKNKCKSLPDELRVWFECPDEWIKKQQLLEMQTDLLLAELEMVKEYIKLLKNLAGYLAIKTELDPKELSRRIFMKVEQDFPEYLRSEIEVDR